MIDKIVAVSKDGLHTAIYKASLGTDIAFYRPLSALGMDGWEEYHAEHVEEEVAGPSFITGVGYQGGGIYERVNAIYWGTIFVLGDDVTLIDQGLVFSLAKVFVYDNDDGEYKEVKEIEDYEIKFGDEAESVYKIIRAWGNDFEFGLDDDDEEYFSVKKEGLLSELSEVQKGLYMSDIDDNEDLESISQHWALQIEF